MPDAPEKHVIRLTPEASREFIEMLEADAAPNEALKAAAARFKQRFKRKESDHERPEDSR